MKNTKRPQAQKATREQLRARLDRGRSSAAEPVPSGTKYRRVKSQNLTREYR